MSDYVPTPDQFADWLRWVVEQAGENPSAVLAEYRRMIAEVERAAAAKALTDAANRIQPRDMGEGIKLELQASAEAYRREGKE